MTVLLINNNRDEIGIFGEALRKVDQSIRFEHCVDGADALRFLQENPGKTQVEIFMDEQAFSFLEEMRNHDAFAAIPVTVYTNSTSPEDIDRTIAFGASFFPKPNSYIGLVKLLKRKLGNLHRANEAT